MHPPASRTATASDSKPDQPDTSSMTDAARGWLDSLVAPWVKDLNLVVECVDRNGAHLRMPFDARLCREGGTLCGQALAAAADTAMILAIGGFLGGFKPMTTVSLNVDFMRPVALGDVTLVARVVKPGKSITFGEILLSGPDGKLVARANCTYAML